MNKIKYIALTLGRFFEKENKIRALTFHEIDTFSKYSLNFNKFKTFIDILIDYEFVFYKISDLKTNQFFNKKSLFLTFDDGHISTLKAINYLEKKGIKATLYLVAKDYEYDKKDSINRLPRSFFSNYNNNLFEIGCHSYTHSMLSTVKDINKEVLIAKNIIEHLINERIYSYSIPYGKKKTYNEFVLETIKKNGFNTCCTQIPSPIDLEKENFLIPRIGIWNNDNLETLMLKINGNYDFLKFIH